MIWSPDEDNPSLTFGWHQSRIAAAHGAERILSGTANTAADGCQH